MPANIAPSARGILAASVSGMPFPYRHDQCNVWGARGPILATSTRTYPRPIHAVSGPEPSVESRVAVSRDAATRGPRLVPTRPTVTFTHTKLAKAMSWPHAHGMASGLLVASGHARAPRLAVAPLAGGPMIGLCPASIMRAVTLGARPRRREVRARMKPSLRE